LDVHAFYHETAKEQFKYIDVCFMHVSALSSAPHLAHKPYKQLCSLLLALIASMSHSSKLRSLKNLQLAFTWHMMVLSSWFLQAPSLTASAWVGCTTPLDAPTTLYNIVSGKEH